MHAAPTSQVAMDASCSLTATISSCRRTLPASCSPRCTVFCAGLIASRTVRNVHSPVISHRSRSRQQLLTCSAGGKPPTEQRKKDAVEADTAGQEKKLQLVAEVKEKLQRRGVDKATARQILRAWKENGISTPEDLRKVLVDNALRNVRFVAGQLLFDGLASGMSLYTAEAIKSTEAFGPVWSLPSQYVFLSVGLYFGIGVLFTITTLGAAVAATMQYNGSAGDVLQAMRELADQPPAGGMTSSSSRSGTAALVDVAGRGRAAVDSIKVANALNSISDLLKGRMADGQERVQPADLYRDLCAYLTLDRAERQYGFEASQYGLTDGQASNIAMVFNEYDLNGDGALDHSEMALLCEATFQPLTQEEVQEAMRLVDQNKDGRLQFGEFVRWWTQKVEVPQEPAGETPNP